MYIFNMSDFQYSAASHKNLPYSKVGMKNRSKLHRLGVICV
jgi:hypothetical protein